MQQDDGRAGPGRQVQQREAAEAEHEHDLLGGVGDRRERIRAEDRQREPLRQQGLAEAVAAQRLADEPSRYDAGIGGHTPVLGARSRGSAVLDGFLTVAAAILTGPLRDEFARVRRCWE
jgi:hypothetical protein